MFRIHKGTVTRKYLMEMMNVEFNAANTKKLWKMRGTQTAPVLKIALRTTAQALVTGDFLLQEPT
jgi:hypothetical protein